MLKYFKPKSVTWWAGIAFIVTGFASMFPEAHPAVFEFGDLFTRFTGGTDASPAALIISGFGFIGLRAKWND